MGKPNPLNSSGRFHRGRRKDTRKGLVSSTSSQRNTYKKRKTIRDCRHRRRRRCRKHITRKITGGGVDGFINVVVKFFTNDEKPDDFNSCFSCFGLFGNTH